MNFNLYLDRASAERLDRIARKTRTPRNKLIRDAVEAWLDSRSSTWPEAVMHFKGNRQSIPFESHRTELLAPVEDPLGISQSRKPRTRTKPSRR